MVRKIRMDATRRFYKNVRLATLNYWEYQLNHSFLSLVGKRRIYEIITKGSDVSIALVLVVPFEIYNFIF